MTQAFGIRLKTLRKQKRLSQIKLGRAVGVHYNQIGLYERGTAMPSVTVLDALARTLGVSTDALLHDPPAAASTDATRASAAASAPSLQPTEASSYPDARLAELLQASRDLSDNDRRTVIALLEAFILKSRITAMAVEMQGK